MREETLAALLESPDDEPEAYAIFAHCFTCSKDIAAASRISRGLAGNGFAVLRFDFTGLGNSEGDFANTNFSSNVEDLEAAAGYLQQDYQAPKVLIGHSLGGAAVLSVASRLPEVRAVATIGAPSDPSHISHLFQERLDDIEEKGRIEVKLAGRSFTITKQFLNDITSQRLEKDLKDLGKALMIFHSPRDQIVGIRHARELFEAAKHPKSFVSLDEADHLLSRTEDSEFVSNILAAWAVRYISD